MGNRTRPGKKERSTSYQFQNPSNGGKRVNPANRNNGVPNGKANDTTKN